MINKNMEKFTNFYDTITSNSIIGTYFTKNDKEGFQNHYRYGDEAPLYIKIYTIILALVNVFICAWALYTASKCAEPICNFMIAVCAPHVYVVYRMARPCVGKK